MATVQTILAELEKKGSEKTRKIYANHGVPIERCYGVSVSNLKLIAKTIRNRQTLASELYATGMLDAMYLAGMVADGSQMTRKQLQAWAEGSQSMQMISEYAVPWLAVENSQARDLALAWIKSKKEHIAAAGWSTYSGLVATQEDDALDLKEIQGLLNLVATKIAGAQNRVRYAMNVFVISVGSYVKPLLKRAKAVAKEIGTISVNMGNTACKVPAASTSIAKAEAAGRIGRKRKTMRC